MTLSNESHSDVLPTSAVCFSVYFQMNTGILVLPCFLLEYSIRITNACFVSCRRGINIDLETNYIFCVR